MSSAESRAFAIVLAAGEGSRMRSERPKPLHMLCGRPMLMYVLDALEGCGLDAAAIVVGHKGEWVTKKVGEQTVQFPIEFVEQRVRRGTGDATLLGMVGIPDDTEEADVIVTPGDTPLLRASTLQALVDKHRATGAAATVLTAELPDATGYGRVVRGKDGRVSRIVEQLDASPEELEIREINTSVYCFRHSVLAPALRRIEPDNAQGEYYLTDVISVLSEAGYPVEAYVVEDDIETSGVNDRTQLAAAEAELRRRTNESLLRSGVSMLDPASTFVDTTVTIGQDVTLFPGTLLQGSTTIGDGCEIGPNTRLIDCVVGANALIEASTARHSTIGSGAIVGPYAVLSEGSEVEADRRTGPFYTSDADG